MFLFMRCNRKNIDPRLSDSEYRHLRDKSRFNHIFYQMKTSTNTRSNFRDRFFSVTRKEKGNFPFPR